MSGSGNKQRSTSRRILSALLRLGPLTLCLASAAPSSHADELEPHRVENLAYGQALFEYYQDHELNAITRLMIAEERPQTDVQQHESNLLLADLYYGYGLYEESRQRFAQLLGAEVSDSIQNRIWFNLARLRFDQGYHDQSLELLARINDRLPDNIEAERKFLQTNLLIGNQQYDDAADLSNRIDAQSIWKFYARYNLAVSLVEGERSEQGRFLLDQLGQIEAEDAERLALRDRANLSLGLKQIRLEQPESAIDALSRVRLHGPLSHEALLASGWAWHQLGQYEKALVPWRELLRRNSLDSATQEAILAIPANYAAAGENILALRSFESAAEQFNGQLALLDLAVESIENDGLVAALREHAILFDRASLQRLPPSSDVTPYLHRLLASPGFQREIKRYQQLLDIRGSLRYWGTSFPALELMLEERRRGFIQKLPKLESTTSFEQLDDLRAQRDLFADQVGAIERDGDYLALVDSTEQEHLDRLGRVASAIENVSASRNTAYQADMHRLLSGLLHYELETDFPARFWQAKKQLLLLDRALGESEQRASDLRRIRESTELEFASFDQRISGQEERIRQLRSNVSQLLARQEAHINKLAIEEIRWQQRHVVQLRLNARFELAKLYDELAADSETRSPVPEDETGEPGSPSTEGDTLPSEPDTQTSELDVPPTEAEVQ